LASDIHKNRNNNIRPKTAFKKKEAPIKLVNRKILKLKPGFNAIKKTKINYNSYNNYNSEEDDIFFSGDENTTKTNQKYLPSLSQTEPNIFNSKRAQSANIKFKIKLENINNMFKNEPKLYCTSQKKIIFKHRGLIPGIPNDLLSRLKLVFKIFKNTSIINYVKKAPSKRQLKLESITDYLWAYKADHTYVLDFYSIFFYYLCTNIQYDIKEITTNISSGELTTYMASDSKSMSIEYLIGVISKYRSKIDIMREIGLTYYHMYRNVINDIYNEIYG
jgi:hypothetical protein